MMKYFIQIHIILYNTRSCSTVIMRVDINWNSEVNATTITQCSTNTTTNNVLSDGQVLRNYTFKMHLIKLSLLLDTLLFPYSYIPIHIRTNSRVSDFNLQRLQVWTKTFVAVDPRTPVCQKYIRWAYTTISSQCSATVQLFLKCRSLIWWKSESEDVRNHVAIFSSVHMYDGDRHHQRHSFECSGQILLHQYSVIWCKHW